MLPIIKGTFGEVLGYNCKINYTSHSFWYKKELIDGEVVNTVVALQVIDYENETLQLKTKNKTYTWKKK